MVRTISGRDEIERVLADPDFVVPSVEDGTRGIAWLRSNVCRFVNGDVHARRRALIEGELSQLDPDALRVAACELTEHVLARGDGRLEAMDELARTVPLTVLCRALGVEEEAIAQALEAARVVGSAYLTGTQSPQIDAAVERLAQLLPRAGSEQSAAVLALLAQAYEATAALIGNALVLSAERTDVRWDADALLAETLRNAAPLRVMRRVSLDGEPILLDLDAAAQASTPTQRPLTFGSGLRPCPGERQALALALGVLEAVLASSSTVEADGLACAVSSVFRSPVSVRVATQPG
jgi:cytochrome P450